MFLSTLYLSISRSIDNGRAFSTMEIWSCVFQSREFHPCDLVPCFPVPSFPPLRFGPTFFQSWLFQSRIFHGPAFSSPAFSASPQQLHQLLPWLPAWVRLQFKLSSQRFRSRTLDQPRYLPAVSQSYQPPRILCSSTQHLLTVSHCRTVVVDSRLPHLKYGTVFR